MEIKVNLIIDSNYILYKNVFSLMKTRSLYGDLERALEISFNNYFKKFPFEKVYMVSDSRAMNWRKQIYPEYKGTRKKDEEIDWEFVFNTYDQFKQGMKSNPRVVLLEEEGIEGDDWIFSVVKFSNRQGISTVIVGSDGDLQQLLTYSLNPQYINIQWRDAYMREKLFFPKGYKLFIKELNDNPGDIFDMNNNHLFLELLNDLLLKCETEEVNQVEKLFLKIIQGDSGDNIKAVYYTPQKSGRMVGIGDKGVQNIWESYKSIHSEDVDFKSDEWIENVIPIIAEYKKVTMDDSVESTIKRNLTFNRRLVHLHQGHYPAEILNKIKAKLKNS